MVFEEDVFRSTYPALDAEQIYANWVESGNTNSFIFNNAIDPTYRSSSPLAALTIPYAGELDLVRVEPDEIPSTDQMKIEARMLISDDYALAPNYAQSRDDRTNVQLLSRQILTMARAGMRKLNTVYMCNLKGNATIKVRDYSFDSPSKVTLTPEDDGVIVIEPPAYSDTQEDYGFTHEAFAVAAGIHSQANAMIGVTHNIALTALETHDLLRDRSNGTATPGVANYQVYPGIEKAGMFDHPMLMNYKGFMCTSDNEGSPYTIIDIDSEIDDSNAEDDLIRYLPLFSMDAVAFNDRVVNFSVSPLPEDNSLLKISHRIFAGAVRTRGKKVVLLGIRRRLVGGIPV